MYKVLAVELRQGNVIKSIDLTTTRCITCFLRGKHVIVLRVFGFAFEYVYTTHTDADVVCHGFAFIEETREVNGFNKQGV